ncbi:33 kDa inner dynein arm light chain, axonemal, partial [Cryptotermes secundus]
IRWTGPVSQMGKKRNAYRILIRKPEVSSTPATRLDVINLQEQLDMRLQQRQARETGICPVRRELYTQCFDELIRQVTINCAERGLLLLRIRDEIRMTISAYQILYESSIAFGIRKALMAEQGKADLENTVTKLQSEKSDLDKQVMELRSRADQIERRSNEQKLAEAKKHAEDIQFLKKTNQQLKVMNQYFLT